MPIIIQTNVASLQVQKNQAKAQSALQANFNKLSSGFRINSAADDAAGLAVSERMRVQIRSMVVAERNANDAISMAQVAEAALGEITNVLARMRELSTQAANGSLGTEDRSYIQTEFLQLQQEISRIQTSTKFNGVTVVSSTTAVSTSFQIGPDNAPDNRVSYNRDGMRMSATGASVSVSDVLQAQSAMSIIDSTLQVVSRTRATYGAMMNRFDACVSNLTTMRTNIMAASSRIRDVDVAEETASLSKNQILSQAGAAILAQANQTPQIAMGLLRS